MIARALDAGTSAAWVTADEVYGADPGLRTDLERRQVGYVLPVATMHRVITGAGACQASAIARRLPRCAWQRYSAGQGAKGHRWYDWAWASIGPGRPGCRWLLIRPSRRTSREPAGQIPLTRNEIAWLFATLVTEPARDAWHCLRWSAWRRRHQHRAKTCHYQRQARQPWT
jgi:hypothetical protein